MLDKIGPMTVTGSHSFQGIRGVARFLFVKGFFLAKCCRRESWFLSYPEICQMMVPPLEMDDRILDLTLYSWSQDAPISTVAISCHVPANWLGARRVNLHHSTGVMFAILE